MSLYCNLLQACTEEDRDVSAEAMREKLEQRIEAVMVASEGEELPVNLIMDQWRNELEHKASAREQDVGASETDLAVCPPSHSRDCAPAKDECCRMNLDIHSLATSKLCMVLGSYF